MCGDQKIIKYYTEINSKENAIKDLADLLIERAVLRDELQVSVNE